MNAMLEKVRIWTVCCFLMLLSTTLSAQVPTGLGGGAGSPTARAVSGGSGDWAVSNRQGEQVITTSVGANVDVHNDDSSEVSVKIMKEFWIPEDKNGNGTIEPGEGSWGNAQEAAQLQPGTGTTVRCGDGERLVVNGSGNATGSYSY